jgi:hypothetical protein
MSPTVLRYMIESVFIPVLRKQQMDGFHNIIDPFRIDGIMNEFPVAFGFDDAGPAQDRKMLGGDGLFEPELYIKLGDRQPLMFVEDPHNLLPQLMIERAKDHGGLFQIDKIYFYCSVIPRLCIEDHPIITACTSHTVRSVEGVKKAICIGS